MLDFGCDVGIQTGCLSVEWFWTIALRAIPKMPRVEWWSALDYVLAEWFIFQRTSGRLGRIAFLIGHSWWMSVQRLLSLIQFQCWGTFQMSFIWLGMSPGEVVDFSINLVSGTGSSGSDRSCSSGSRAGWVIGCCSVNNVPVMFYQVCVVCVICFTMGVMICFGSRHQLSMVVDFKHSDLRCFMWSSIWIGTRVAAKLCGNMTLRVKFVCPISMMWDRVSALCCGSTGEFEVQLSQLSHFHDLSMFGPFLIGARIMQVVA